MPLDTISFGKYGMSPDLSPTADPDALRTSAVHEAGHVLLAFSNGWQIEGVVVHTMEHREVNDLPGGRVLAALRIRHWDHRYPLPWCREVIFRELAFACAGTVAEVVIRVPECRRRYDWLGFALVEKCQGSDWQHFSEHMDLLQCRTGRSTGTFATKAIHHAYSVIRSPEGRQFIRDVSEELIERRFLTDADCRRHWHGVPRSDDYYDDD